MTRVLVLGGTGWLSGRIAERWRDAGAQVTCLARGARPAPAGTVLVHGDRDDAEAYAALRHQQWDEIVDVSSRADHVRGAVAALGDRTQHWTFVSTVSVYADDVTTGADESAARHPAAQPGDEYDYAAENVAAEDAVLALDVPTSVIRPGLIVGAGDQTDRFGYWAAAFARAGDGPVLVPPLEDAQAQIIDVDDVAAFAVGTERTGIANATGDSVSLRTLLEVVRTRAGHTGEVIEAPPGWLEEQGVAYWAGERSLPLWLPADMPGFTTRSNDAYRRAGGTFTPLVDTIDAVRADEQQRGYDRVRRSGLTREDELALLDALP